MFIYIVMAYVFVFLSIEYVYRLFRCMINRPVVYDAWPNKGACLSCGEVHS